MQPMSRSTPANRWIQAKWNKIEHRLFSHISMNWRGRALESHEVIVQLIAATTTSTGLTVQAELDEGTYPKGVKISDQQMDDPPSAAARRPPPVELHPQPRITSM